MKWFGLILLFLILLFFFISALSHKVVALDKGALCATLNLTINDCDLFWNQLNSNQTIIINNTINNQTIIYNNYTQPVDLAILQEQNRHDEAIAKINKGIIDNNGSQSILTGNFATLDGLNNALNLYGKTSYDSCLFDKYYLGKVNNNTVTPTIATTQPFWDTSYPLFIGVGLLIILIYVVPKYMKRKPSNNYFPPSNYQDLGTHIPKDLIPKKPIKPASQEEQPVDGTE